MANKPYIMGIDPGNIESAFCLCSPDLRPLAFEKCRNKLTKEEFLDLCQRIGRDDLSKDIFFDAICNAVEEFIPRESKCVFVIEDIESFGMPAGRSVFDTAKYIGRLDMMIEEAFGTEPVHIYRHEEKQTICHSQKANDATIKRALIDRFAPNTKNYGKGTKKDPGYFYGFKSDCWSAFAIAVTYHDKYLKEQYDE